jgi:tetratricopeptide (TPR) repeat protein
MFPSKPEIKMKNILFQTGKRMMFILLAIMGFTACDALLENELPDEVLRSEEALNNADDLQRLLNSTYDVTANYSNGNKQRFSELMADNIRIDAAAGFLVQVFNRASDFFNSDVAGFYGQPYISIFRSNLILENLDNVSLNAEQRSRFEGEALFLRAIAHFELVRLFGQPYGYTSDNSHPGIVIKTTTDPEPEGRNTVGEVYAQIISDLQAAENLLPESNGNYANRFAAKAYLAKVHFQMNDFSNAARYAQEVINSGRFTFSPDINNRFKTGFSSETIFGIISTGLEDNRAGSFIGLYRSDTDNPPFMRASNSLLSAVNTDSNDGRRNWFQRFNAGSSNEFTAFTKFNADWLSVTLVSTTEMMLITAESLGELNQNLSTAISYLNQIKGRAGISQLTSGASAALVVSEARRESRLEFAGEGHRLHQLKRIGAKGEFILIRNAPWDCPGMVLQFPASELAVRGFLMNPEGGCN